MPLRQLYPDPEDKASSTAKVDIVAVHGLNPLSKKKEEHAWDTWRKPSGDKGRLWLRDDLPKALPESRIFLYEYDSTVAYGNDQSTFIDKANTLLEAITLKRRDANQRPLLLLGHSLGGLLIKQALINALNNERFTPIKDATVGLAFFATPHNGGDQKLVRMGNIVAKVAISLGFKAGGNIVKTLESESIFTDIMKEHWRHQLLNYNIRSFWGTHDEIVPRESARLGLPGKQENIVLLTADHSNVCKFDESQADRDNYELVEGNLEELYDIALRRVGERTEKNATPMTREERACLRHLFSTDQAVYKNDLKRRKGDRARGTCEWIIQEDELQKWLGLKLSSSAEQPEHASNILWLYGNPGTGKSTMAITMVEELPKLPCFFDGAKFLAYFFCDSSSENKKTATSILRTLIYQFITQQPQLIRFLLPEYEKGKQNLQSFSTLWSILMDIGHDSVTGDKYCIIDALDECDEQSKIDLLGQIDLEFKGHTRRDSKPKINILIISRKYPEIDRWLRVFDSKDLALYPSMADDLDTFIEEKVEELAKRNIYPQETADEVSQILHEKAEKTFLWVGIAYRALIDVPSKDAVKKLSSLPRGLESLYRTLLDSALALARKEDAQKEDNYERIWRTINFVAISRRPLSVLELAEACQWYPDKKDDTRICWTEEVIDTCRLMVVIQNGTVQLLHKSVRDFLLGSPGGLSINELEAHASMANRCINFLQRTFRQGGKSESCQKADRFLEYALLHWTQHASSAHNEFYVVGETESFFRIASDERETWLSRYRAMRPFERIPEMFSVFHVAARWGIASLVRFALSEISGRDEKQSTQDNNGDTSGYDDLKFEAKNGVTPLEEAAREGRTDIIDILLENALTTMVIRTAVVVAAAANQHNAKTLVALLLDRRGDQIQVTEDVVKAAAWNRGGEEVMALLLDRRGYQIQITEDVVKAAAGNMGGEEVMALLLKRRGDQIQITEDVVKAAAGNQMKGKEVMALLLDQQGDQIQITDNVVKAAVGNRGNGKEVMALLLKQQGHQIQITKDVVKAAAGNGRRGKEVMALLLRHLERQIQSDPLQTSSWNGNIENVEQLLADGANAASANRWGWTPLHAASWNGHIQVIKLLLAKGAHPTAKSNFGWTPLDAAFVNGHVDTVRLLLPHDPDAVADFTPTSFSDIKKSGVLELDGDKLEVKHVRTPNEGMAAPAVFGSVYANKPISPLDDVFYFEIEVISSGHNGAIGLGVCRDGCSLERMPGWEPSSWGYHGDDGKKFHSAGQGQPYAEKFGDGDIIGCRLEVSSGTLEFFKNGCSLEVAFTNVHGFVFPVVGIGSYGAHIRVDFRPHTESWRGESQV